MSVFLFGITAGLCPLNIAMVTPYVPSLVESNKKLLSAFLFSLGISIVFVPLGVLTGSLGSFVLNGQEFWLNLIGGAVILFVGLWTFRVIRLPLRSVKIRKISGGIFMFGVAYALVTLGRGAPMLLSTLSLISLEGDALIGGFALIVYSFCLGMPLIIFAAIMEKLKIENKEVILRRSVMLERATGVLLMIIGAYYVVNAIMAL
ncbi:MAG: cytochrome c biogenesis protein CcdA [Candidatus Methanomethyliaceae archaeon]